MVPSPLDMVDRGILYHLQRDAHQPLTDIADALGVADNTVRNRIEKLEGSGVIKGYTVDVDYTGAGFQHHYLFICTVQVGKREQLVQRVRDIPGVVRVTSVMTGQLNVIVEAVGGTKTEITQIAYQLDDAGLLIEREHLIWDECRSPYTGFRVDEPR